MSHRDRAVEFLQASEAARDQVHSDVVVIRTKEGGGEGITGEKQIVLSPTAVFGSQEYRDTERRLSDAGIQITRASSSALASTINVSTALDAEQLLAIAPDSFTVVNKPRARPRAVTADLYGVKAFFPDANKICPDASVAVQATMVDQLKGRMTPVNRGAGVMVIVWDFLPASNSVTKDLLSDRPGGPMVVYRNGNASVDPHGLFVASLVGGTKSGLCTESTLVILGINDPLDDLAIIEKLADNYPGPVIVNFSAALEFPDQGKDSDLKQTQQQCALYDAAVNRIKAKNRRIVFVCAAGNESLDLCGATGALSWEGCTDCVAWPQNRFGSDIPGPFVQVGATTVDPSGSHAKASYSNFGRCVDVFTHGGNVCGYYETTAAYTALQGTSFASPAVSAVLAAIASMDPANMTSAIAVAALRSAQREIVSGVDAATTTKAFAFVPDTVIYDKGKGVIVDYVPLPESEILQVISDGGGNNNKISGGGYDTAKSVVVAVLVLLLVFLLFLSSSRKSKNKSKKKG